MVILKGGQSDLLVDNHVSQKYGNMFVIYTHSHIYTQINIIMNDKTLNINLNNVFIVYTDDTNNNQQIPILNWVMINKGGHIAIHRITNFMLFLIMEIN